jgi:hypothetical protein
MSAALEQANAALRNAVIDRLDSTPADDPKMRGYQVVRGKVTEAGGRAPQSAFLRLLDEIKALHESKSADYGSEADPLANIRNGADFVDIEPWKAAMVRIADKVQRLRTYCRTGRLVHEGVRDTLLDLASYSLLAIQLYEEEQNG